MDKTSWCTCGAQSPTSPSGAGASRYDGVPPGTPSFSRHLGMETMAAVTRGQGIQGSQDCLGRAAGAGIRLRVYRQATPHLAPLDMAGQAAGELGGSEFTDNAGCAFQSSTGPGDAAGHTLTEMEEMGSWLLAVAFQRHGCLLWLGQAQPVCATTRGSEEGQAECWIHSATAGCRHMAARPCWSAQALKEQLSVRPPAEVELQSILGRIFLFV